jgi:CarD family transcriptional regulator
MGFAQGETVVHPQHGTATVRGVRTKDLGHGPTAYLELHIESGAMTILIPTASVEQLGIRPLTSRQDAEAILRLLEEESDVPVDWSERRTATDARLKSRDLAQIAMAVRDLLRHERRIDKAMSNAEQTALRSGLAILADELSLSLGLSVENTMALLVERGSSAKAISGDAGIRAPLQAS